MSGGGFNRALCIVNYNVNPYYLGITDSFNRALCIVNWDIEHIIEIEEIVLIEHYVLLIFL